jgi:hypothetical protein
MRKRFKVFCFAMSSIVVLVSGCGKKETPPSVAATPTADTNVVAPASRPSTAASPGNTAPGPAPIPAGAKIITGPDTDSVLAQLTRELHRTMIGRKLSGSFDEFVAISHVQPPPPPAGKKYAISKQWHVVLVNN